MTTVPSRTGLNWHSVKWRLPIQMAGRVLLDLHLPDMSGEGVLRQLWEKPTTRQMPILVLTADATPGLVRRLKAAGATDCLTKPLDIKRLLQIVDELLTRRPENRANVS